MKRNLLFAVLAITGFLFGMSSCQKAPELTITGPTNIELSADGSSASITFTANRDWKVTSSDSWVSVSPSSGTAADGAVSVTVRCNANTTYEDRTATVTIKMEELSQAVMVKQPANLGIVLPSKSYNLESGANSIAVEVQANVGYSVSSSVDWIKQTGTKGLSSTTYTFSVEENTSYDNREGTITIKSQNSKVSDQVITVKQSQKDALIVKDKSFNMPYGGGAIEFKVESNVDFEVKPDVDWIHYVQTKALSNSTVVLKIDENTTYSSRQGTVEIKQQNGSLKHTITVNQAGRIAVTSIELNKTDIKLKEGETETLVATVKPDNATDKKVSWSSSNTAYATVDETGKVTALKEGPVTITAKAGEKSATCTVTVYKEIPVTGIELDNTSLSLVAGNEISLVATVKPDDATDKTVSWTSSNESIVTINAEGKVKAVAKGNAIITAKTGNTSATCAVFVKAANYPTPSGAVDLGLSVVWGEKNLGASSMYDAGSYYLWGDPTGTGIIMFFETPSTDYIVDTQYDIAKAKLGKGWRLPTREEIKELLSSCSWAIVSNGVRLTGPNGKSIILPLTGMGFPADGAAGSMSITNKDKGYLMTGESYSDGSTRFAYVYHYNQSFTYNWSSYNAPMAKFPVRPVFESPDGTIPVSSVSLNNTDLKLKVGASETLTATVLPNDATDKTVTWRTSDASVASVDDNGKVTAITEGSATITAKAGDKSASCAVSVSSSIPKGNISFADNNLKQRLVSRFDSNGDGELSYQEAAAVTDFTNAIANKTYTSFDEFQYFTGVQIIPNNCFMDWTELSSIVLPSSINTIGAFAFASCKKLTSITIPDGVKTIMDYAFSGAGLTSIVIPDSVTDVRNYAFSATNVSSVSLSKNAKKLENTFLGCKELRSVTVPYGVEVLDGAFFGCSNLESVSLPNSVKTIKGAFYSCANLPSINIPGSVTIIGDNAFSGCVGLTEIILPESVTSIGKAAFYGIVNLKTIVIPQKVTEIGKQAFESCTSLSSITVLAKDVPTGAEKMFNDTNNCPIYVPADYVDDYKNAYYWKGYADRIKAITN